MKDNIMFIPSVILLVVEALALGFLTWSWFDAKRRNRDATELKPCPFCGGAATHWHCTANGLYVTKFFGQILRGLKAEHNVIACNKCGCRTKVYAHKRNAFKAWNRRAEEC